MREPETKEINGKRVTVQPWPAMMAWRRQTTLGKIFGPSLKALGESIDLKGEKTDIDLGKVGEAFGDLFNRVGEDEAERVLKLCLNGIRVNDVEVKAETIDMYFDTVPELYKAVAFVLEVNYGSFLAKGAIGKLLNK